MKSICIILLILLVGCTSSKQNIIGKSIDVINTPLTPKIIFLNYKASKKLDEAITVNFISKIIIDGRLKVGEKKETSNNSGDFACIQLDKDSLPINSLIISNPLIRDIEYFEPSGLLGKKRIELDSTEFSVRMQLNPHAKFISLKVINNPNTMLLTIAL